MYKYMFLIDILVFILIYIFIFYKKWYSKDLLLKTLFYIYLVTVLYLTLFPIVIDHIGNINLIPFLDIIEGRGDFKRQVILNILMTIPFGFIMGFIYNNKVYQAVFKTFLFSISIEFVQLFISARSCDITDIITNTFGGLIGIIIFMLFRKTFSRLYIGSAISKLNKNDYVLLLIFIILILVKSLFAKFL